MYACDGLWWDNSGPAPGEFAGERWSSTSPEPGTNDDKREFAERHGLKLITGQAHQAGFSFDLGVIHYGDNSGFQAVNLALQFGATEIWLIGFDMHVNGKEHFFGSHPAECRKGMVPGAWRAAFEAAERMLPPDISIVNATPGSALSCFPRATL